MCQLAKQSHYALASRLSDYGRQSRIPKVFWAHWKQTFAVDPVVEARKYIKQWRKYTDMLKGSMLAASICVVGFAAIFLLLHVSPHSSEGRYWIIAAACMTLLFLGLTLFFWCMRRSIKILRTERHKLAYEEPNEILFLFIVEQLSFEVATKECDETRRIQMLKGKELILALQKMLLHQALQLNRCLEASGRKPQTQGHRKPAPPSKMERVVNKRHNDIRWHLSKLKYIDLKAGGRKQD